MARMDYWSLRLELVKLSLFFVHLWAGWRRPKPQPRLQNYKVTVAMETMMETLILLYWSGKSSHLVLKTIQMYIFGMIEFDFFFPDTK